MSFTGSVTSLLSCLDSDSNVGTYGTYGIYAWGSKIAGGGESLFGFVALESDVYSSGTIGDATVAATQALGYQQVKPQ